MQTFDTVCFSSGGIMGVSMLGFAEALYRYGILNNSIIRYIGTSVGSIIALLLSIGYKPIELLDCALILNIFNALESVQIETIKKYGIITHEIFLQPVKKLLKDKIGRDDISLLDLYLLTGKHLVCTSTDLTNFCAVYLDYINTPNISCIEAVMMSSSIPGIFPAICRDNITTNTTNILTWYIDGAFCDPMPMRYFDNGKNHIIGVYAKSADSDIPSLGLTGYLYRCTSVSILEIERLRREKLSDKAVCIDITIQGMSLLGKGDTQNQRVDNFMKGYKDSKNYIQEKLVGKYHTAIIPYLYTSLLGSNKVPNSELNNTDNTNYTVYDIDNKTTVIHCGKALSVIIPSKSTDTLIEYFLHTDKK